MLPQLFLLSLRSLLVSATGTDDDDDISIEDDGPKGGLPFPGGKMPSAEELLKMLDSMGGLSDEEKESLRQDLLKSAAGGVPNSGFEDEATKHLTSSFFASQFVILIGLLAVIAFIFVFFGYKLYKSLSERERKREEKKKNKQMKKKK